MDTSAPLVKEEEKVANPSKKKGTGGETELLRELRFTLPGIVRTPPGTEYDLADEPWGSSWDLNVLATRPDHGQWLMTMDLEAFKELLHGAERGDFAVHIEVKRYARFALHTIWNTKFGRKK